MAGVRAVHFTARDRWAGATHLFQVPGYMRSKAVKVVGPALEWQSASLVLLTASTLGRASRRMEELIEAFRVEDPAAVALGIEWHRSGRLTEFAHAHATAAKVLAAIGEALGRAQTRFAD